MCPAEDPNSDTHTMRAPIVLIVEDEVLIRLSIAEHLREQGFSVIEASSAEEARAVFLGGLSVDFVFSDVHMTDSDDGFALAEWLADNHPDVLVMLTSGVTTREQAASRGATPFINKPYAAKRVEEQIRAMLARRRGA